MTTMREWQPIETAPKAGRWLRERLARDDHGPEVLLTDGDRIYIGFWNGRSWDDGDLNSNMGGFTHWMPLPKLPATD